MYLSAPVLHAYILMSLTSSCTEIFIIVKCLSLSFVIEQIDSHSQNLILYDDPNILF